MKENEKESSECYHSQTDLKLKLHNKTEEMESTLVQIEKMKDILTEYEQLE